MKVKYARSCALDDKKMWQRCGERMRLFQVCQEGVEGVEGYGYMYCKFHM